MLDQSNKSLDFAVSDSSKLNTYVQHNKASTRKHTNRTLMLPFLTHGNILQCESNHSSQFQNQKYFDFFALARELRDEIYEACLHELRQEIRVNAASIGRTIEKVIPNTILQDCMPFFQINRQFRREALEHLQMQRSKLVSLAPFHHGQLTRSWNAPAFRRTHHRDLLEMMHQVAPTIPISSSSTCMVVCLHLHSDFFPAVNPWRKDSDTRLVQVVTLMSQLRILVIPINPKGILQCLTGIQKLKKLAPHQITTRDIFAIPAMEWLREHRNLLQILDCYHGEPGWPGWNSRHRGLLHRELKAESYARSCQKLHNPLHVIDLVRDNIFQNTQKTASPLSF
jgi:hypothetical protein